MLFLELLAIVAIWSALFIMGIQRFKRVKRNFIVAEVILISTFVILTCVRIAISVADEPMFGWRVTAVVVSAFALFGAVVDLKVSQEGLYISTK